MGHGSLEKASFRSVSVRALPLTVQMTSFLRYRYVACGWAVVVTFFTDLPARLASVIGAPCAAGCVYAVRNWSAGTPLIRKAITAMSSVPPNATLRSEGDLPSCVRTGWIASPAGLEPRKSEPLMLSTCSDL